MTGLLSHASQRAPTNAVPSGKPALGAIDLKDAVPRGKPPQSADRIALTPAPCLAASLRQEPSVQQRRAARQACVGGPEEPPCQAARGGHRAAP